MADTSRPPRRRSSKPIVPVPTRVAAEYGEQEIVIERREIVARIQEDPESEHPMLRAAFMAVSDNLAHTITESESQSYEFTHGGHKFSFSATPVDAPEQGSDAWKVDRALSHLGVGDTDAAMRVLRNGNSDDATVY
jgi:hypothetical protein